jgi:hypothetical protein
LSSTNANLALFAALKARDVERYREAYRRRCES